MGRQCDKDEFMGCVFQASFQLGMGNSQGIAILPFARWDMAVILCGSPELR